MLNRSLRVFLALFVIVLWWCFTPCLFRAEFEFGIEIPDDVISEWSMDRYYGPSRTMTALGFNDRWEEGSCTKLIIPASRLVEFLEQFNRKNNEFCTAVHGAPWSRDRLLREPWAEEEVLGFRTTMVQEGKFGDYVHLEIKRLANNEFECLIRSSWD